MQRSKVATSHGGKYSYWIDLTDRYVYQLNEFSGQWVGWLCCLDVWERTFSRADWMVPNAA